MNLPSRLAAALASIAAALLVPHAARAQGCTPGAYRGPAGAMVALTSSGLGTGARYTFVDGRRGFLLDASSPLVCDGGRLRDRADAGGAVWARVPTRAWPTHFRSGALTLNGLLLEPVGVERPPLVVLVHGSEKSSPIGLVYQTLLAGQGVAVFAYDKRGTGGSEGTYTQDFIALAEDAASAAREARRLAGGRTGRLGFFGGSQGGWVAPLAALKANADFLEVGFGVAGTAAEQDQWQVDTQLRDHGYGPEILPRVHALTDATAEVARSNFASGMDKVKELVEADADEPWLKDIDGQYSGELVRGELERARAESPQVPWNYAGLDIVRSLRVPQLWVFAADDDVAPAAPSLARLAGLRHEGVPLRAIVFPNCTHGMIPIEIDPTTGKHSTRDAYVTGYLALLADFAKGTTAHAYGEGRWSEEP
jgi:pimeloyl-ACP methyl ester carboxylesterase